VERRRSGTVTAAFFSTKTNPRQLSPAGIRLFELQSIDYYRLQHAWPVQQLPPSQQSAKREVARAVPKEND
jgi:hypothetical protein